MTRKDECIELTRPTPIRLESLFLTEDELQTAKKHVEDIAYSKWQAAGCPEDDALRFWREAELEWIEYYYVPDR